MWIRWACVQREASDVEAGGLEAGVELVANACCAMSVKGLVRRLMML